MKIVLQRVSQASVAISGEIVSKIEKGYVLFVGIGKEDTSEDVTYLAKKISQLRLFPDESGKMTNSLKEVAGKVLSVSQFTLFANTKKGNRPSFVDAQDPVMAEQLYETFNKALESYGVTVETGQFGADMQVSLENDGPVTILLDSKNR